MYSLWTHTFFVCGHFLEGLSLVFSSTNGEILPHTCGRFLPVSGFHLSHPQMRT